MDEQQITEYKAASLILSGLLAASPTPTDAEMSLLSIRSVQMARALKAQVKGTPERLRHLHQKLSAVDPDA